MVFGDIDCYALKAEKQYPPVLPFRNSQEEYWISTPAETIAKEIKKAIKSRANRKGSTPIKYIRVNEAGDFTTEACIHKLIMVAELVPNIKFYTYTHRSDLVDDNTHNFLPKNLVINTSNFKRQGLNQFKAVKVQTKFRSYTAKAKEIKGELKLQSQSNFNCGGDCAKCSLCKFTHTNDIYVAYH